jgi:hypothetical protein
MQIYNLATLFLNGGRTQGDQIGRVFAYWVIVYFGKFENYKSSPNFGATFSYGKLFALILTKNVLGHILGDFFATSSGHPVSQQQRTKKKT